MARNFFFFGFFCVIYFQFLHTLSGAMHILVFAFSWSGAVCVQAARCTDNVPSQVWARKMEETPWKHRDKDWKTFFSITLRRHCKLFERNMKTNIYMHQFAFIPWDLCCRRLFLFCKRKKKPRLEHERFIAFFPFYFAFHFDFLFKLLLTLVWLD